jgi:hypothetical protein
MTTVHNSAVGADADASMVLAATKRVLTGRYFCLRPLSGILYRLELLEELRQQLDLEPNTVVYNAGRL